MAKGKPVQQRFLRPLGKQGRVAGKRRDFQPRLGLSVPPSFNAELQEALELYV